MINCFLDLSDYDAALNIFQSMQASRRTQPYSRFLWYCLALRRQEDGIGTCLMLTTAVSPTNNV